MTWIAFRSRGEILRDVTTTADARRDGLLPLDVEGVRASFRDELELLGALQLRWHTRLSGRIERELASQPLDLEQAVVTAWQATADELPGIRAILDHYRDQPVDAAMAEAMRTATAKEHTLLAVMAGRAGLGDAGAPRVGAAIEERARDGYRPPRPRKGGEHAAPGLVDRLRAVLAA
ncbi:hypothetical protein [Nocardioides coralli]|uniref:hypothetical protein n=1 Tax=Nocardioides coralli TaxID=2872154 RepID=UPI001CA43603|nr:hypothetical protein [Nocardioides coralli]QZY28392.1 hypothetical protein K6T13_13065 [Nocardioides coralli]